MTIDVMELSARAQRAAASPRTVITPERNAEVFRMAHIRSPRYWELANEISNNVIKGLGVKECL